MAPCRVSGNLAWRLQPGSIEAVRWGEPRCGESGLTVLVHLAKRTAANSGSAHSAIEWPSESRVAGEEAVLPVAREPLLT